MESFYAERDENNENISGDGKASDGEAHAHLIQPKILGSQIALVRRMLGFTQATFGDALGITPQTQSLLERGQVSSNNIYAKLYFSLMEIRNDPDTFECLEEYQRTNINSLLGSLMSYIRISNVTLNERMKSSDRIIGGTNI